ncbi:hypothetical protein LTR95_015770 [Oleoguttula sp. CCFEE 5521]
MDPATIFPPLPPSPKANTTTMVLAERPLIDLLKDTYTRTDDAIILAADDDK